MYSIFNVVEQKTADLNYSQSEDILAESGYLLYNGIFNISDITFVPLEKTKTKQI